MTPARHALSLMNQFTRVLSNLHQLRRVAEIDGDEFGVHMLAVEAEIMESAMSAAPSELGARGNEVLAALVEAGNALNALARRANAAEELPPKRELRAALQQVQAAVLRVFV
jgi:hypothetical protein